MKRNVFAGLAALAVASSGIAYVAGGDAQGRTAQSNVAQRQALFAIEHMTCATCPISVRTAMRGVSGVSAVQVDFDAKTARVTYDPRRATVAKIAAASTNAGYPARVVH